MRIPALARARGFSEGLLRARGAADAVRASAGAAATTSAAGGSLGAAGSLGATGARGAGGSLGATGARGAGGSLGTGTTAAAGGSLGAGGGATAAAGGSLGVGIGAMGAVGASLGAGVGAATGAPLGAAGSIWTTAAVAAGSICERSPRPLFTANATTKLTTATPAAAPIHIRRGTSFPTERAASSTSTGGTVAPDGSHSYPRPASIGDGIAVAPPLSFGSSPAANHALSSA